MFNVLASTILLKIASLPALSAEDWARLREAPMFLSSIQANLLKKVYNPFEGLTSDQKAGLFAYLIYALENAMTREEQGHTPLVDSVRTILKDDSPYKGKESELDYDLAQHLNKLFDRGDSPLSCKIGIDERGTPYASKD